MSDLCNSYIKKSKNYKAINGNTYLHKTGLS